MARSFVLQSLRLGLILLALLSVTAWAEQVNWPREIKTGGGARIVIYQPQPEEYQVARLTARAAVAVTPKDAGEPVFGAVWFNARLQTDRDNRLVNIQELKVSKMKFPGATDDQQKKLAALLEQEIPKWNPQISMDRLLTTLEVVEKEKAATANIKVDPPRIIYSAEPAVLVLLDGDPQLHALKDSTLMQVVNTPYFMVFNPADKTYYLNGGHTWFGTSDLKGLWQVVATPPAVVTALAPEKPEKTISKSAQDAEKSPHIIVASEPTELIVTQGEPTYSPAVGSDLFYAKNTDSHLFLESASKRQFVLISGRWYAAPDLKNGPWTYVAADQLPASFSQIPKDSPKAAVLAHVAGTPQAEDALMDAQIPQTAAIDRKAATLVVSYDGEPKFEPIEGTQMTYAANTGVPVIRLGDRYYACHQGVWFEAPSPSGPWVVCTSVPSAIYTIPPSSPVYPVRYVQVYESTPDTVYVGYTSGYLGSYPYEGTVVYGTGYVYRPWYGAAYYPRPGTYGYRAAYNPYTGAWGYRAGYTSPSGLYNMRAGHVEGPNGGEASWVRAWGPGGGYGYADVDVNRNIEAYGVASRGAVARQTNIYANQNNLINASRPQTLPAVRETNLDRNQNNIMVDANGEVFRRTDEGWQQRSGDRWAKPTTLPAQAGDAGRPSSLPTNTARPETRPVSNTRPEASARPATSYDRDSSQLDREYQARQRGAERTSSYQRQQSVSRSSYNRPSTSAGRTSSYNRPSGGKFARGRRWASPIVADDSQWGGLR